MAMFIGHEMSPKHGQEIRRVCPRDKAIVVFWKGGRRLAHKRIQWPALEQLSALVLSPAIAKHPPALHQASHLLCAKIMRSCKQHVTVL